MRALLFCTVMLCVLGLPARAETVGSIPRPRPGSWSVDTTGTLSSSTLAGVDRWGSEVDGKGLGQLAVVVVGTTGGRNPRSFATELFNLWGIGHAGRDDGALLLIALRDRKAEIVRGDGVDSRADTARSDALMSGEIVPAFSKCPQCEYKTKTESTTTLESATYDHGGRVRVNVSCEHCSYRNSFTRSTPRRTRPSSSSSGGGRSSGGGSSFGGGRSSGGGSSGSW